MPLELRRQKDGIRLRPYWYGRFEAEGKRHCVKLCEMEGRPPASLSLNDVGDKAFERSRQKALAALAVRSNEAHDKRDSLDWVRKLHELQHGESIKGFPLADLVQAWERMPKKKNRAELHPRYVAALHSTLRRFVGFVQERYPNLREAGQVTRAVAAEFIAAEEARGLSAKARNDSLKRLRAVFRSLLREELVARNPFEGIPLHTEDHVHRRPLTQEEVGRVLEAVQGDDFMRPLVVCALSTAMRCGDCCCLKWADVHLDEAGSDGRPVLDHIKVKTSKTGETVTAPIDAPLKEELLRARPRRLSNGQPGKASPYVWPEQAGMHQHNQQGVTWRVRQMFQRAGLGDKESHVERKRGMRRASLIDFHSLRTTWITNKLAAGVPIEAVKLTSGHRTADVVRDHYYKPGEQQHLRTLLGKPSGTTHLDQLREVISGMTAKTWRRDKTRLIGLLSGDGL